MRALRRRFLQRGPFGCCCGSTSAARASRRASAAGRTPRARRLRHDATRAFASPLNARSVPFCSAFPDVDAPFGSIGIFSFRPRRGSCRRATVRALLITAGGASTRCCVCRRRAAALRVVVGAGSAARKSEVGGAAGLASGASAERPTTCRCSTWVHRGPRAHRLPRADVVVRLRNLRRRDGGRRRACRARRRRRRAYAQHSASSSKAKRATVMRRSTRSGSTEARPSEARPLT